MALKRVNKQADNTLCCHKLLILETILSQTACYQQHAEYLPYLQLHKQNCGKLEIVPGGNRSPELPALMGLQKLSIDLLYQRETEEAI